MASGNGPSVVITHLEDRSPWFILAFAGACALGSCAWPFGVDEAMGLVWPFGANARALWFSDPVLLVRSLLAGALLPHGSKRLNKGVNS